MPEAPKRLVEWTATALATGFIIRTHMQDADECQANVIFQSGLNQEWHLPLGKSPTWTLSLGTDMAMQRTEPSCHAKGVSSTRRRDLPAYFCIAICISMSHVVASVASTCPRKCECIWRDAKITVDCSNQGLGSVPTDVDVSSQVLNVSGNHIPLFNGRQFSRFGLTNLQRISASNCGLGQIDGHAFQGLTNLVELNLDNNNLAEVNCCLEMKYYFLIVSNSVPYNITTA